MLCIMTIISYHSVDPLAVIECSSSYSTACVTKITTIGGRALRRSKGQRLDGAAEPGGSESLRAPAHPPRVGQTRRVDRLRGAWLAVYLLRVQVRRR